MFDVGTTLVQSAERNPGFEAIVDLSGTAGIRRSYAELLDDVQRLVTGLSELGIRPGDRVVSVLQNRAEAATLHWACQYLGAVITPLNWRLKGGELDYCVTDVDAKLVAYETASAAEVDACAAAVRLPHLTIGEVETKRSSAMTWQQLLANPPTGGEPQAQADDLSLILYTSGTTGRPKGVPRTHGAERAAAVAHVAQNGYDRGERTLGVMPLYHTMGVRSLLTMSLVDGCFVCQPRFEAAGSIDLVEAEAITSLYLVPTLYHEVLEHPGFASERVVTARKLGFAGASMTDGLLQRVVEGFRPDRFVNHYGSSEIYTFTIEPDAPAKPGSAGRAGINQRIRVVELRSGDSQAIVPARTEGEIIASLRSDESFAGYWNRLDADEKSIRDGWYFTGDTGLVDDDGDLFVTGRVDDMMITGGENVTPVEVESVLSLHRAVAEVVVVGLPDERWGQVVTGFVRTVEGEAVTSADLDAHCKGSDLADFKRPRRYEFVVEIPKSPTGKILRRLLVAGEYEAASPGPESER